MLCETVCGVFGPTELSEQLTTESKPLSSMFLEMIKVGEIISTLEIHTSPLFCVGTRKDGANSDKPAYYKQQAVAWLPAILLCFKF